jgi:hypothetical protein
MSAESARTAWTDQRLDDFQASVFARFDGIDQRLDRMDQRLDLIEERIYALHRVILTVGAGMMASILVGAAGIVATQL